MFGSLQEFFNVLFTYQKICSEDFENLKINEKLILKFILKNKKYSHINKLYDNIDLKSNNFYFWNEFAKERRKEENMKFGFKFVLVVIRFLRF